MRYREGNNLRSFKNSKTSIETKEVIIYIDLELTNSTPAEWDALSVIGKAL